MKKAIELIRNPAPCIDIGPWSVFSDCFHLLFSNIYSGVGGEEQGWMESTGSLNPAAIDLNRGFNQSANSPAMEGPTGIPLMQQR